MKKLKLPVSDIPLRTPPRYSMDEYLGFVLFNFKHTLDQDAWKKFKRETQPIEPFRLK
ncbi:MAG: hypothetical protein HY586_08160 [Candidatus Omnitrophica bacterium]|nr:hypothetical protein [Candidatus Omnitrophota bacterium]